ncbi:kinetochore protein Nuf2 [Protopterus annectens]|uniref:kinetochore protein Nuf2 n=1 Tax=Protopterus annectens TaxID=7888 RepID=UPI001CFABC3F|nr:kinetochore protein Nuf2 [Protopterus annectens]
MATLTFPILKVDDIVSHFRTIILVGFPEAKTFTRSDIVPHPKPEVLQRVLLRVLQIVLGVRQEHFYMMPGKVNVHYPQLMDGFTPLCNLAAALSRFLPKCHINDFSLGDLLNPKPKRIIWILSGTDNFLQFRDQRRAIYIEHTTNFRSIVEKAQQLQKCIEEFEKKIQKLTMIPPEQQEEVKELTAAIQKVQQKINQECRPRDTAVQDKLARLKAELQEKTKSLGQVKMDVATLKDEQARLRSQIVESPDQLKSEMEKLKETVKKLKKDTDQTNEACVDYQNKVESALSCKRELQLYYNKLVEMDAGMGKLSSLKVEDQNLKEEIESLQKKLKTSERQEEQLKRVFASRKEKLRQFLTKKEQKKQAYEQDAQKILEDYTQLEEKWQKCEEQGNLKRKETALLKLNLKELGDILENVTRRTAEQQTSLMCAMKKHDENLSKEINVWLAAKKGKTCRFGEPHHIPSCAWWNFHQNAVINVFVSMICYCIIT